jgi:hypothetical protein
MAASNIFADKKNMYCFEVSDFESSDKNEKIFKISISKRTDI